MTTLRLTLLLAASALALGTVSAKADAVSDAKAFVAKVSTPNAPWAGPTTGPKAAAGKTII